MLSTCWVLVKKLKGSEFNVHISEMARLENIFMCTFLKREMATKIMSLFVGVPWLEIMKYSVCVCVCVCVCVYVYIYIYIYILHIYIHIHTQVRFGS